MMGSSGGLNNLVKRLFYTNAGSMLFSAVIGLAVALLFRRVCKDRKCVVIHSPPAEEMNEKIFMVDGDCYKYVSKITKCDDTVVNSAQITGDKMIDKSAKFPLIGNHAIDTPIQTAKNE